MTASPYAASAVRFGAQRLVEACSWCHRIHDERTGWGGCDADVTDADVTHGICPDCIVKHFPDLNAAA